MVKLFGLVLVQEIYRQPFLEYNPYPVLAAILSASVPVAGEEEGER